MREETLKAIEYIDEPICGAAMETQTLRTDLWTLLGWKEEGDGWRYGESNMETYITIIDSQRELAV